MSELLFSPDYVTKLSTISREDLELLNDAYRKVIEAYEAENAKLRALVGYTENQRLAIEDQLLIIRHKIFFKSSEKKPDKADIAKSTTNQKKAKQILPSLRYPDLPLVESSIDFESAPSCECCENEMTDMGTTENAEYVTVTQKTYHVVRQKRHKYRCSKCHSCVVTANAPKRIKAGSGFSDEMMIDVCVAKYADHVPIERYAKIAARQGLTDIQPSTLIGLTHHVAAAALPIYEKIKQEVQSSRIILADETWWRMMENDPKTRWQLWGFFNTKGSFFEAHDTRAGTVAAEFLKGSQAEYLMSDAFSGYAKCTQGTKIINCYCNAHARRKFVEAELIEPTLAGPVIEYYKKVYQIESEIKGLPPDEIRAHRQDRTRLIFESMRDYVAALQVLPTSALGKAQSYMLKNWIGLTKFLEDGEIPPDNNQSERGLRNPVVGRKNYYGNHSPQGAHTTAVLYTIMQSCKQHNLNPQTYLTQVMRRLLSGEEPTTPYEFAQRTG
jgi:transposase